MCLIDFYDFYDSLNGCNIIFFYINWIFGGGLVKWFSRNNYSSYI